MVKFNSPRNFRLLVALLVYFCASFFYSLSVVVQLSALIILGAVGSVLTIGDLAVVLLASSLVVPAMV